MYKSFLKVFLVALCLFAPFQAFAENPFITVASTTSTANSGLFDYILPEFTKETGIDVHVVAVGTGQAVRLARNGDADVLFVHHRASEDQFVADGFGERRYDVMYNDFIFVGPKTDPAHVNDSTSLKDALSKISAGNFIFASRGDDSGTNKRELALWKKAGIEPDAKWYRATGSGMGATLNFAAANDAYALSDRGTWLSFKNKQDLKIVYSGDDSLFNPYGVIVVSKEKFPHIKADEGQKFVDWLISAKGQELINSFKINGQQLFIANAK